MLVNQPNVRVPIPAVDVFGRPLQFRMSTPLEMGGADLTQPPGLAIDPDTGYSELPVSRHRIKKIGI